MTLDQAIFDLQEKGLPCPSAISVFILYERKEDCYYECDDFKFKFNDLVSLQKTIHEHYLSPV
jgi:hypothetical protein